jgi:ABC-type transporter Mla subunit MlaD
VPDDDARPGTPLWVKVFGAIALVVVLVFVVLLVVGSGHGPGRHAASADPDHTPSTQLTGAQPQP